MKNSKCLSSLKRTACTVCALICLLTACGCSLSELNIGNNDAGISLSNKVTVPDFVGLMYADIISDSNYLHYKLNVQYQNNDNVPKGQVISQSVDAGKSIKKSQEITLVVSNGPELIVIPQVYGLNARDAIMQLVRNNLQYNEIYQPSESVTKGCVIITNPSAGSSVTKDQVIDIYISNGPQVLFSTVGEYSKLHVESAKKLIEKDGFTVGEITYINNSIAKNYVISQSKKSGEYCEKGAPIDLVVSAGIGYEYTLVLKDELLDLVFEEDYKDMTLSLYINGEETEKTPSFDANLREGAFEFNIVSSSANITAVVKINFENGEKLDAFVYNIDMKAKTAVLTKSSDLYDHVLEAE